MVEDYQENFNFARFKQYLEGIAGGNRSLTTATQHLNLTNHIVEFLAKLTEPLNLFYYS